MRYVLDAGALIAVDRRDRTVLTLLRRADQTERPRLTSAAVVAQVWRGEARQANLARVLAGVQAVALTSQVGRGLGVLLAASRTADVVDAHVASLARPGDLVLTSDPADIERLLAVRGVAAAVHEV